MPRRPFQGFLHLPERGPRPRVTIDELLAWADAHHEATGRWPNRVTGRVLHAPRDETWSALDAALYQGCRGLPRGLTLRRLLSERRDVQPRLTVARILAWADAHFHAKGEWPTRDSGAIPGTQGETWARINDALMVGRRGLTTHMTLGRLLAEQRGVRNQKSLPKLTIDQILAWADAHRAATGVWPTDTSGPVRDAPEETWSAIDAALLEGLRGLPGRMGLSRLLVRRRGRRRGAYRPEFTIPQILAWADAYHAENGRWPSRGSGQTAGPHGESWSVISEALTRGGRGLPGGSSLARLLAEHRNVRNPGDLPRLTVGQILAWADAHHAATGQWPNAHSGPVRDVPGEDWRRINSSLHTGHRGLPGGSSLLKLLAAHRPVITRAPLSLTQIRS